MEKDNETMDRENKVICRTDSPMDGPADGVTLKTECVRTDFAEIQKDGEPPFKSLGKGEASITASMELGVFSIRDRVSNVMLTISILDAMEVLAAATEAAKEVGECTERTSDSAETAESESDS